MSILIVNADDFGRSPGINRGIVQAHERGIVTSTSVMVRWPAAREAAAAAAACPRLSFGLHLDLGEWAFVDGDWQLVYAVTPVDDPDAVSLELSRQLNVFRQLTGRWPTHLDSHQHVHRREPVWSILLQRGRELGVPVRHDGDIRYCGGFYGQTDDGSTLRDPIGANALCGLLGDLGNEPTELACHPAAEVDFDNSYATERLLELETLCDARVREAIVGAGRELRSFADVGCSREVI